MCGYACVRVCVCAVVRVWCGVVWCGVWCVVVFAQVTEPPLLRCVLIVISYTNTTMASVSRVLLAKQCSVL